MWEIQRQFPFCWTGWSGWNTEDMTQPESRWHRREGRLQVKKCKGRLGVLREALAAQKPLTGQVGIGHTRWATHGEPNDVNAHPHVSQSGKLAVVHNGIIENYLEIKQSLLHKGVVFASDTDTEVIVQLLEYYYKKSSNLMDAVYEVLNRIKALTPWGSSARISRSS